MSNLDAFDHSELSYFEIRGLRLAQSERLMKVSTDSRLLTAFASRWRYNKVLDAGCGVGVIGLLLAVNLPSAQITLIDKDPLAVGLARFNAEANSLDNAEVIHEDLSGFQSLNQFDLIVSNPPYFIGQLTSHNGQRMLFRHSSSDFPFEFASMCKRNLSPDGIVCIVLPGQMEERWSFQMARNGFILNEFVEVFHHSGIQSSCVLLAYSLALRGLARSTLQMQDNNGRASAGFDDFMNGF